MNTIIIMQREGTTYVGHSQFWFPAYDGDPIFELDAVMKVVAVPQGGKWRTNLTAVELASYLSKVQGSPDILKAAYSWCYSWAVRKVLDEDPMEVTDKFEINWVRLMRLTKETMESSFSFDTLKHALKSVS
jgi:hypothetical protein